MDVERVSEDNAEADSAAMTRGRSVRFYEAVQKVAQYSLYCWALVWKTTEGPGSMGPVSRLRTLFVSFFTVESPWILWGHCACDKADRVHPPPRLLATTETSGHG